MWMHENAYGFEKRLHFVRGILETAKPETVMDIGCGIGTNVTRPLAEAYPKIKFVGIDSDRDSIDRARRENGLENVSYLYSNELDKLGQFDLIIASEVIEHVEDPKHFLVTLRSKLSRNGRIIMTLPNGYGPFELMSLIELLFRISGIYRIIRRLKRTLFARTHKDQPPPPETLALSPHINFFSYRGISALIAEAGFEVIRYRGRTLLCGFALDHFIHAARLTAWNARIADKMPPLLVSDWMFELAPAASVTTATFKRSLYARIRRRLNLRYRDVLSRN